MRYDVECPYCGHGQNICHDDGYGYEEDQLHQQYCGKCGKTFGFNTWVSFYYETKKVPCFQDDEENEHNWIDVVYAPQCYTHYRRCKHCDAIDRGEFIPNWRELEENEEEKGDE